MVFALTVTLLLIGEPPGDVARSTAILATIVVIGGIAFRHQGTRFRRTFLEHGVITEMAARDGLTGLKNRRAFDEHLIRVWQQALRDRRPLVVMLVDVDHFKKFNDRYGHQSGDEALQRIARVADDFAKRPLDLAARFGGEEFAIILYDMTRSHAKTVAGQLLAAVQDLQIAHRDNVDGIATISIGVAIVQPRLARSPEGVVQLADEAMYRAKKDGRNRAVLYEHEYEVMSTGIFKSAAPGPTDSSN
jgi:diguanylate cyclase (GGDEF)-like protein